jgi:hypothetical protein
VLYRPGADVAIPLVFINCLFPAHWAFLSATPIVRRLTAAAKPAVAKEATTGLGLAARKGLVNIGAGGRSQLAALLTAAPRK